MLLGSIWKDEGWWLKILCAVFVGRRKNLIDIYFSTAGLPGHVWGLCFKWLGVSFVSHIDPTANFDQFRLSLSSDSVNEVWSTIWVGVVSELWNHRNFVIFNRGVADALEVFTMVQAKIWSWISVKSRYVGLSYSNWCLKHFVCMRMILWSYFSLRVGFFFVRLVMFVRSWFWCILYKGWTTP